MASINSRSSSVYRVSSISRFLPAFFDFSRSACQKSKNRKAYGAPASSSQEWRLDKRAPIPPPNSLVRRSAECRVSECHRTSPSWIGFGKIQRSPHMYWPIPASGSPDLRSADSASERWSGRAMPDANGYRGGAIGDPHEDAVAYVESL